MLHRLKVRKMGFRRVWHLLVWTLITTYLSITVATMVWLTMLVLTLTFYQNSAVTLMKALIHSLLVALVALLHSAPVMPSV